MFAAEHTEGAEKPEKLRMLSARSAVRNFVPLSDGHGSDDPCNSGLPLQLAPKLKYTRVITPH